MGKIDLWSLITGVVSIVSFLLGMWDKFPRLKKYLLPLGYILLGFTISRVTFIWDESFVNIAKDSYVAGSLIIIAVSCALCMFCFHSLLKRGQEMMAYMIVIFFLLIVTPRLIESFSKTAEKIPPKDYLLLSVSYEKNNDYDTAIKYLSKYLETVSDAQFKDELKNKITQLQQKQIGDLKLIKNN